MITTMAMMINHGEMIDPARADIPGTHTFFYEDKALW